MYSRRGVSNRTSTSIALFFKLLETCLTPTQARSAGQRQHLTGKLNKTRCCHQCHPGFKQTRGITLTVSAAFVLGERKAGLHSWQGLVGFWRCIKRSFLSVRRSASKRWVTVRPGIRSSALYNRVLTHTPLQTPSSTPLLLHPPPSMGDYTTPQVCFRVVT